MFIWARFILPVCCKQFGNVESALAAYNAGEDRVTSWTAGQNYREPAEFVDSIPFTETRQYVEIVTRNADIYRKLYGATCGDATNESRKPRSPHRQLARVFPAKPNSSPNR